VYFKKRDRDLKFNIILLYPVRLLITLKIYKFLFVSKIKDDKNLRNLCTVNKR